MHSKNLFGKDILSLAELSLQDINSIINLGIEVKKNPAKFSNSLNGKILAMLFQKTSTRTRMSFETAMLQMGGSSIFLDWKDTNLTLGALTDEVKCMERYCNAIMARVFSHSDIEEIANASSKPVINGLSDLWHPCQALADLQTIKEKFGKLEGLKLAYIGDGNNVCNSLIDACSKTGIEMSIATPRGFAPKKEIIEEAKKIGSIELFNIPADAAKGADVVYTDTWVSMGQEKEKESKISAFNGFTVNLELMAHAKKNAVFMHCLPVHRGFEATSEVIDSRQSIVFDQAENRLHSQKAVLLQLLS
jgi:ornithine carbamoyltransferase